MKRLNKYKEIGDLEIQSLIRSKDQACIEFTYNNYYAMITAQVKQYNPGIDAQDIYQEAFMVMLNAVYSADLSCKISTYLYAVSRNLCLKKLRSIKHEADVEIVDVADDIAEYDDTKVRYENIMKALSGLGEKCREIIKLYYLRAFNMEEVATELGYTNAANAKNQKYKCMKQLKERLNG